MVQNGSKTYHLEHLGGLGPEMVQRVTKTYHLEHLGGLESEIVKNSAKIQVEPWDKVTGKRNTI